MNFQPKQHHNFACSCAFILTVLLTGCASKAPSNVGQTNSTGEHVGSFLSPYRVDIQQGNYVSREQVAQMREGMTQEQVRFLLGTPLLNDIFHVDRWDYHFSYLPNNGISAKRNFVVLFKNGVVSKFGGDEMPEEMIARQSGKSTILKAEEVTPATPNNSIVPALAPVPVSVATTPSASIAVPAQSSATAPAPTVVSTPAPAAATTPVPIAAPVNAVPLAPAPIVITPSTAPVLASASAPVVTQNLEKEIPIINTMLRDWLAAWSSKNVARYFSFYASSFSAPNLSRTQWEKQRRERLTAPSTITINATDIRIHVESEHATVVFIQNYRSNITRDVGTKTLTLVKAGNHWLIESESFVPNKE